MLSSLLVSIALFSANAPTTLVKAIMVAEIAYIETDGVVGPFDDDVLDRAFTEELANAYAAIAGFEPGTPAPLDFDPITGHDDAYCPLRDVVIDDERTNGYTVVEASFRSQWCLDDEPDEVRTAVTEVAFDVREIEGEWLIEDLRHSAYGSLLVLLESAMDR